MPRVGNFLWIAFSVWSTDAIQFICFDAMFSKNNLNELSIILTSVIITYEVNMIMTAD